MKMVGYGDNSLAIKCTKIRVNCLAEADLQIYRLRRARKFILAFKDAKNERRDIDLTEFFAPS